MNSIKKILVPIDFSPACEQALREGEARARIHGAELIMLHVVQELPYSTRAVMRHSHFPNLEDEIKRGCMTQFEDLRDRLVGKDVKPRLELREGTPSQAIADFASDEDVDLIVISTHGNTGFKRLLLGSTTERLVRLAPCSVLVTREKQP